MILWSLINSVKNNKDQKAIKTVGESSKNIHEYSNDGAEFSVNPQIQNTNETSKNAEEDTTGSNDKKFDKKEYFKIYRENNKEKYRVYQQKYRNNNKEKIRIVRQKYYQNNKEKVSENNRKYYQKKKNEKEIRESLKIGYLDSDNNEGTSFVNPQIDKFRNKGKEPIVFEENLDNEGGNQVNQGEEKELNEIEAKNNLDDLNQIMEPTKIPQNEINQKNLNKNNYRFDLNEKPEEEEEED
uniref:Uncharacterized protein n=1 Tax=Meloidogyne incognita TaxID=6306 RepID=A0A914MKH3_MELIC